METASKRINGEFHLPEPIIQHIQSFMSGKEAAQTSILSKPWHAAWSTRPNLDFDDNYKQPQTSFQKTIQRYQHLNLNIQSFRLHMNCSSPEKSSFARELIVKAMRMGAVDLDFKLQRVLFPLPQQVLGSETLTRLSVANCKIYPVPGQELKLLSSLKSLVLRSVYTQADLLWAIISNCPSIENLELSECICLFPTQGTRTRMLALKPDKLNNRYRFHKLKSLLLDKVVIGTWIFDDFSSRFPCLKDLALHNCFGYGEIKICSRSLERMSFALQARILRATFDVPNVRKFKFSGSCIPSLFFHTTKACWESDISIACERNRNCLSSSWFSKLNKLLTDLSPSVVSLSLAAKINLEKSSGNCHVNKEGASKRPWVKNLTLSMEASAGVCTHLLDGLFSSCRPKLITLLWLPFGGELSYMDYGNIICSFIPWYDLKDVRYEFEENHDEWRPFCWNTLLNKRKIRVKLRFMANKA